MRPRILYIEAKSGDHAGISGPKKAGGDRHYTETGPVRVDVDVRLEYWTDLRNQPERSSDADACR